MTLGGWNRAEVNAFFERYEMNSMRTRMGKLMTDGLLGEPAAGDVAAPTVAECARHGPRSRCAPVVRSSSVLAGEGAPLVAYNHERVAVLNATSGALAVVPLE